ncbi:ABC transporter permease [Candidatus Methylacidithermus pantelleriae]|uniref:Transport permease protein n=1 Tax=Candidatus Methylacidithermus pantelleriae TaxID=2744239 RepID=A0A8J2BMB0_9BACT|nr:ABC transporter permease [Candidatus Methylacidithermus pantelleriae]CAF0705297.1 Transport permease protein [Candidatus Methylacidithermus pantelleriae]
MSPVQLGRRALALVSPTGQGDTFWWRFLLPWNALAYFYRYRYLIAQLAWREIAGRYKGTHLGVLWSLVNPLLLLGVFLLVFGLIFEGKFNRGIGETRTDYALGLFCGLSIFNFVAEVISRSPTLLVSNANYVTKVVFPLEVLGLAMVLGAFVHLLLNFSILLLGCWVFHGALPPTTPIALFLFIPLGLLGLGIAWTLSALGVFVRDVTAVLETGIQVLMYGSAIFYSPDLIPRKLAWVELLIRFNPIAQIINETRRAIVFGFPLNEERCLYVWIVGGVGAFIGLAFFLRSRHAFADVL